MTELNGMTAKRLFEYCAWFCGCGGSSWGLELAGGEGRLAADINELALRSHANRMATRTYRANLRGWKAADFAALMRDAGIRDPRDWRGVHLWTAPCQGYTHAASGKDATPEQLAKREQLNPLTPMVAELAEASPRSLIVLEQVPGFWSRNEKRELIHARHVNALLEGIRAARGIDLTTADLKRYKTSSASLGVPQNRTRLLLPIPPAGSPMPPPLRPLVAKPDWMTVRQAIGPGSGFVDPMPCFAPLSPVERMNYQYILDGENLKKALDRLIPLAEGDDLRRFNFLRSKQSIWASGLYRESLGKPSRTIVNIPRMPIFTRVSNVHPSELRHYSVGESMRLMSFPLDWRLAGDMYDMYSQISGGVCPPMTEEAARQWLGLLDAS